MPIRPRRGRPPRAARTSSSPRAPRQGSRSPSTCRCSTRSRASRRPEPSTSTRRRRSPRTRRAASRGCGSRACARPSTTATPSPSAGAQIRRTANVILTNPDMLHVGILPNHDRWGDALHNLRYVVVDEAHVYRGVFGSHVGNVLRRLRRLALTYGSEPQFVLASATIANPGELALALTGRPASVVDVDTVGARRARRRALEPGAARPGARHARELALGGVAAHGRRSSGAGCARSASRRAARRRS